MEHLVFWRVTTYLPVTYDIAMCTPQLWLYNAISYSIRNFLFTPHYSVIDYSLQFHGNLRRYLFDVMLRGPDRPTFFKFKLIMKITCMHLYQALLHYYFNLLNCNCEASVFMSF